MRYAIIKYRRAVAALLVAVVVCALGGCSKNTVIPDDDLERIVREMFITNALAQQKKISTDSLDIYTPILEKHGYTQDDFFNTLANFQKRKSARLGDVVEAAIASLEANSMGLEKKLRNLAYIDSLAKMACVREVMFVERVEVKRMKDTARLRLTLPVVDEGEYVIRYNYHIDTLDKNRRLQSEHAFYNASGKRIHMSRNNLTNGQRKNYRATFVPKKGATKYVIQLADYTRREDEPCITFDSIRVLYLPPVEVALARMDSANRLRPMLYTNDSIRAYGFLDAKVPMLAHDTVWIALDSMELAEARTLRTEAKELRKEEEALRKEMSELLERSEKLTTKAQKEWFRNDSLRGVAHAKNMARAEELRAEAEQKGLRADSTAGQAEVRIRRADSLEVAVMGHTVE